MTPETELRLDPLRQARTSLAEAVYGPGKSPAQCAEAVHGLLTTTTGPVLLTRADAAQADAASTRNPDAMVTPAGAQGLSLLSWRHEPPRPGRAGVFAAGTADLPVAREVVATLAAYGFPTPLICDVGVAGIHRLLAQQEELATADVVLVVAGMEGALASVVAGLTRAPVIAVPTSVGYGAGLEGVTALLAMHAACSPGVTVVGIDNGFGAACAAIRTLSLLESAQR